MLSKSLTIAVFITKWDKDILFFGLLKNFIRKCDKQREIHKFQNNLKNVTKNYYKE